MKKIKTLIIKTTINSASRLFKNLKYKDASSFVKVNLGCGMKCLSGWINIDGSLTSLFGSKKISFINKLLYRLAGSSDYYSFDHYNNVIQENGLKFYNLKMGVPLHDNSTDIIYCSHFLEHLDKKDGQKFLEECFRSLKSGGLMRISIPDLDYAMQMYQRNEIESMMGLFFYTSNDWDFAAHKYGYNYTHLKEILEKIGFVKINKMSYQNGECPGIEYLDIYPEHSLFVECRKK
jgi:predicted SAM-dependent methyltransferase